MLPILLNTVQFLHPDTGKPVSYGCVETYESDGVTAKTVYLDAGTTPHTNPIELDEFGVTTIFSDADVYLIVKDKNGAVITQGLATAIPTSSVGSGGGSVSATLLPYNHIIGGGGELSAPSATFISHTGNVVVAEDTQFSSTDKSIQIQDIDQGASPSGSVTLTFSTADLPQLKGKTGYLKGKIFTDHSTFVTLTAIIANNTQTLASSDPLQIFSSSSPEFELEIPNIPDIPNAELKLQIDINSPKNALIKLADLIASSVSGATFVSYGKKHEELRLNDFGSAAYANTGTGASEVPTNAQADTQYAGINHNHPDYEAQIAQIQNDLGAIDVPADIAAALAPVNQSLSDLASDIAAAGLQAIDDLNAHKNTVEHAIEHDYTVGGTDKYSSAEATKNLYQFLLNQQGANKVIKLQDNNQHGGTYRGGGFVFADGAPYAWGKNYYGTTPDGDTASDFYYTPFRISIPEIDEGTATIVKWVTKLSANLLLLSNGDVYAWGRNQKGELGLGTNTPFYLPTKISAFNGVSITDVTLSSDDFHGSIFALFVDSNGNAYGCGSNSSGQLGDGTTIAKNSPTLISSLSNISKVFAGGTGTRAYSYFLDDSGDLFGCGWNSTGFLGIGNTTSPIVTPQPINLPAAVDKFVTTSIERNGDGTQLEYHSAALLTDGKVYTWGDGSNGQLGNELTQTETSPYYVTLLGSDNQDVYVGGGHSGCTIVVKDNNDLKGFGSSDYGQLGINSSSNVVTTVTDVPLPPDMQNLDFNKIIIAGNNVATTYALMSDGSVWSCGYNGRRAAGTGSTQNEILTFQRVRLFKPVADIAITGRAHDYEIGLCLLTQEGDYYQCGYGGDYQIPNRNRTDNIAVPFRVVL